MAIDARDVAEAIVREVAAPAGEGEVGVDVAGWGAQALRALLDALLVGLAASGCRLRGVRADAPASPSSACLGIPRVPPDTKGCPSC